MLVNQLTRDLKSANVLEVCAALIAVCRLLTADMLPPVLPLVLQAMSHQRSMVREEGVYGHACGIPALPRSTGLALSGSSEG